MRDGFRLKQQSYIPPQDLSTLDPVSKKEVTICSLFMNGNLGIEDIVRLLDEPFGNVVQTLINRGLVYERRKSPQTRAASADPRHLFFKGMQ